MKILDLLVKDGVIPNIAARQKREVLSELVAPIAEAEPSVEKGPLLEILVQRENLGSTGIGGGIAIPHGKFDGVDRLVASFGRSEKGVDFHSMDSKPAYLFFLLVAPKNSAGDHLKALARISRLFKDPIMKANLQKADSTEKLLELLEEFDSHNK
jgi:PTS system nitrogen regulatory IIA component